MLTREDIFEKRIAILELARKHGAEGVHLFGSIARGDANSSSDVDFLVRFEPGRSLLDCGELIMDLQDLLGVKVDVISQRALSGRFGQVVRKEAVPL